MAASGNRQRTVGLVFFLVFAAIGMVFLPTMYHEDGPVIHAAAPILGNNVSTATPSRGATNRSVTSAVSTGGEPSPPENPTRSPPRQTPNGLLPMLPLRCQNRSVDLATDAVVSTVNGTSLAGPTQCCQPVARDKDKGYTMYHLLSRLMCGPMRDSAVRMRVLQVGANTGDNGNDPLFKFLRGGRWAEAVLVEPVPWLFEALEHTYASHSESITLVNAAVAEQDGVVPFYAPTPDAPKWVRQMGGFSIVRKNYNHLKKKHQLRYLQKVNVSTQSIASILDRARPAWNGLLPHVVVVDTEGFDATVVHLILDTARNRTGTSQAASRNDGPSARRMSGPDGGSSQLQDGVAVIQYEHKHLSDEAQEGLLRRLAKEGYCLLRVHYDTVAYRAQAFDSSLFGTTCSRSFDVLPPA